MAEAVHQFSTGAVRSTDADGVRYDLISPIALEEIARTCKEGADRYGDHNWLAGMPVSDLLNHALRHIYMFLSGDRSEPHLPHAAWGLMAAIHSDKQWPHLNGNLLGEGCVPPPPKDEPEAEVRVRRASDKRKRHGAWTKEAPSPYAGIETETVEGYLVKLYDCGTPTTGRQCAGCESPGLCDALSNFFGSPCVLCPDPAPAKPHRIPRLNDPRDGSVPPPVLYLSGPMTGVESFNFPAFNSAAEQLRQKGFPVLNPADFGWGEPDWGKNVARDLALLGHAEILVQLPGWETSRGASLEYNTAVSLGKGVVSLSEVLNLP